MRRPARRVISITAIAPFPKITVDSFKQPDRELPMQGQELHRNWQRGIATLMFAWLLGAAPHAANARGFARLEHPTIGCHYENDIENLVRLARELPKGDFKFAAIREYAKTRCVELPGGPVTMLDSFGDYLCVGLGRSTPGGCLWVPAQDVKASGVDDGVF
jgi:hypothetical protein